MMPVLLVRLDGSWEWQDGRRHFSQQSMAQLLADAPALPTSSFPEDLAA
jgi:hypothetical protein